MYHSTYYFEMNKVIKTLKVLSTVHGLTEIVDTLRRLRPQKDPSGFGAGSTSLFRRKGERGECDLLSPTAKLLSFPEPFDTDDDKTTERTTARPIYAMLWSFLI
jgi:hypothetical protein